MYLNSQHKIWIGPESDNRTLNPLALIKNILLYRSLSFYRVFKAMLLFLLAWRVSCSFFASGQTAILNVWFVWPQTSGVISIFSPSSGALVPVLTSLWVCPLTAVEYDSLVPTLAWLITSACFEVSTLHNSVINRWCEIEHTKRLGCKGSNVRL